MQATTMSAVNEDRIREIAYSLWEEAGRPIGLAESHWVIARQMLDAPAKAETSPKARSRAKKRVLS